MQRLLHSFISTVQKAALALAAEKDAAGLAGLHSYCLHAFGPLPQLLKRCAHLHAKTSIISHSQEQ